MGRKAIARAFTPPRVRDDKVTGSFVDEDPGGSGRGQGDGGMARKAANDPKVSDMQIARSMWDGKGSWEDYWAAWSADFKRKHAEGILWHNDLHEHGLAYANEQRRIRQEGPRTVLISRCPAGPSRASSAASQA